MPATYQGKVAPVTLTGQWTTGTPYTTGQYVTPSPPTGQFFKCTTAGTSSATQPAWSSPPFPTIGTTFTESTGVVWTCMGSYPFVYQATPNGPTVGAPVIQTAVDTDPPVSAAATVPESALADAIAYIMANAAFVGLPNLFAGNVNEFTWPIKSIGGSGVPALVTTIPPPTLWQLFTANITDSLGTPNEVRTYYSASGIGAPSFAFTFNAFWQQGSANWNRDNTGVSTRMIAGPNGVKWQSYPSGGASPWLESAWVTDLSLTGQTGAGGASQFQADQFLANQSGSVPSGTPPIKAAGFGTAAAILGQGGVGSTGPGVFGQNAGGSGPGLQGDGGLGGVPLHLVPQGAAPSSPKAGDIYFDSSIPAFRFCQVTGTWITLTLP